MGITNTPLTPLVAALLRHGILGLAAGLVCALPHIHALAAPVATRLVAAQSAGASLALDGTVEALQQATVAAQLNGNVLALNVKAGQSVRAGQPLARLDERDSAAALAQSEAVLAQAEAERHNAQIQLERQRELRRQNFVSASALDLAETQLKAAQAGAQQAQSARSRAALARGFATVNAPFDGIVLATHVQPGDLASPGRAIATVYQPGALRAVVQMPASRAAQARQASVTRVQLPDGRWLTPLRRTELPGTDPLSQTTEWRLDLPPQASAVLVPGQSLRVLFDAPAPSAAQAGAKGNSAGPLSLPESAVLRRGELEGVFVAQGGRFVLRAVRLGATLPHGEVAVLAGLQAGEAVALDAVRAGLADSTPSTPSSPVATPAQASTAAQAAASAPR